jgi:hypothetical protein
MVTLAYYWLSLEFILPTILELIYKHRRRSRGRSSSVVPVVGVDERGYLYVCSFVIIDLK